MNNIAEVEEKEKQLKQDVEDLKESLELQKAALIESYELKMDRLHKELLLRMKVEIHEIEERKNQHINDLMKQHETAFREMKNYYNDITNLNLEMIQIQKTKLQDIKASIESNEKLVNSLKEECKRMEGPLS